MRRCFTLSICLVWIWVRGGWASPVPSPALLLEAWQQLDTDFQKTVRSYKLEGMASKKPHEADLPASTFRWRVWRDGERFLWEYTVNDTLSGGRRYAYSYDGVRYDCYVGPSAQGFIYKTVEDLPPCENAFTGLYPFDIPHLWQKPLAGGNWQQVLPYYVTLLQNVSALHVSRDEHAQSYILLLSQEGKRRLGWLPDEVHFRVERGRFVPVRFILRDKAGGRLTQTVFEITSAQWHNECWLPSGYRCTWVDVASRRVFMEMNATIRMSDINQPISAAHFRVNFPAGTLVTEQGGQEWVVRGVSIWNLWWVVPVILVVMVVFWLAKRLRR
ncbi:MAG: hypothetical protein KatS3mg022_1650 [Armatimonadota bacterium]|nr:MAG: hypothetical protein KatS3mg022_1650 [Armatimonadota bacterium]GIV19083.1 MAG: hypothetical protein KatS3mg023_0834 [Armatimonadota bacterium]